MGRETGQHHSPYKVSGGEGVGSKIVPEPEDLPEWKALPVFDGQDGGGLIPSPPFHSKGGDFFWTEFKSNNLKG